MVDYTVGKSGAKTELFALLEKQYPHFAHRDMAVAFKTGDIVRNGEQAYGDDIVKEGDLIELFVPGDVLGIDLTPRIVYQDENFVIVDKPSGLRSFSDDEDVPNAVAMVEDIMKQQGEYNLNALMVPYLLYPLEKFASGLLIMAKHEEGYLFLTEALAQRRLTRHYICPVLGMCEDSEELIAYHKRDKSGRRVRILPKFQKDAKPIVTRYTTMAKGETMSLISARPVTNLLHQVRAHLAYEGLPILGDTEYGDKRFNRKSGADQICLWVKTLLFETGTGHEYEYINSRQFESSSFTFPRSVYDEGLFD